MSAMIQNCEESMKKRVEFLDKELGKVRTGRASISLVDGIRVAYYGTPTPLNQVASISTPDARTIVISPFEKKVLGEIEKAIQVADIGIQPNSDGNVIRLPVPPLNAERRKEIAKNIHKIGEDAKVAIRKVRQELNTKIKKSEKSKEIAEDESARLQKEVQTLTDSYSKMIDQKVDQKSKEILSM